MAEDTALYLVCYDIADNRRRYRLDKLLKGYGQRVQYSVFECELDVGRLAELKAAALKRIDGAEDRLHLYRLCGKDNRGVKTFGLAQRIIHPDHYIL